MFEIEAEEDYTKAAHAVEINTTNAKNNNTTNRKPKAATPADTVHRLVQQVCTVFPHLGEGYVETALSHYHGDVQRTMSALVEGQSNPSSLPVILQRLDPSLPARWKGPTARQSQKEEEEARRLTQQTVRAMEQQQEAEARALEVLNDADTMTHNEYNDDYDDQYDDMPDGGMSADTGLYDDFDTVRTYNKLLKQVEQEQVFWVRYYKIVYYFTGMFLWLKRFNSPSSYRTTLWD